MAGDIEYLSHDEYQVLGKEQWEILSSKVLCDKRCLPHVTCYTRTRQSSESWKRHTKQHVSFINFKPLNLYWTYLLALRTTTPKVSPKRLMSLDYKPKMRWCTSGFIVILCKYGLLLKKTTCHECKKGNMGREFWFIV